MGGFRMVATRRIGLVGGRLLSPGLGAAIVSLISPSRVRMVVGAHLDGPVKPIVRPAERSS